MAATLGAGSDETVAKLRGRDAERVRTLTCVTAERTVLVEPARKQVVQLAADVLGRLAPEQTPTALRPFARFTPARRRQRGGV